MTSFNLKIWIRALRAPFFTAAAIPVILGAVLAWYDRGTFNWPVFLLTLVGAICIHAGTNLSNDYFDHLSGCDEKNSNPTPFSGGSRVIQDGLIKPKNILYASLLFFILGGSIGFYLNYLCGTNVILILGIIGVFLGFFYTAKPFKIGYGSFGELAVGIGFGPLIVMGAYYAQARILSLKIFLISIPIGMIVALILFINEFPDYIADKAVGKRTLVVILGKRNAVILYHILLIGIYIFVAGLIIFKILPIYSLIVFLTLPLMIKAFKVSKNNFDKICELLPANAATIGLSNMIGLLLVAGLILDKLV